MARLWLLHQVEQPTRKQAGEEEAQVREPQDAGRGEHLARVASTGSAHLITSALELPAGTDELAAVAI